MSPRNVFPWPAWPMTWCVPGLRVRGKRYGKDLEGIITMSDPAWRRVGFVSWCVHWDDGTYEWCREAEMQIADAMRKGTDR